MCLKIIIVVSCLFTAVLSVDPVCVDRIQEHNLRVLSSSLKQGYSSFCEADVDQGVLSFYAGGDSRDAIVELAGYSKNRTFLLKDICNLCAADFDYSKKTIIYVSGFVSETNDMTGLIRGITKCSNAYNIIILHFSLNLAMLYNTALYNTPIFAYAVIKTIDVLLLNKVSRYNIILVGHSQGAQIAALTAKQFHQENGWKLPLVIALDPAIPCDPSNQHVNPNVADQVLVIHGNNRDFGLKDAVGTVDYYPNGDEKLQPGCSTQACSHEFPVRIFAEFVCNPISIMAIRCKDWNTFQRNMCFGRDTIPICLRIPLSAKGKYYSTTKSQSPYGLAFLGLSPNKLLDRRSNDMTATRYERDSLVKKMLHFIL